MASVSFKISQMHEQYVSDSYHTRVIGHDLGQLQDKATLAFVQAWRVEKDTPFTTILWATWASLNVTLNPEPAEGETRETAEYRAAMRDEAVAYFGTDMEPGHVAILMAAVTYGCSRQDQKCSQAQWVENYRNVLTQAKNTMEIFTARKFEGIVEVFHWVSVGQANLQARMARIQAELQEAVEGVLEVMKGFGWANGVGALSQASIAKASTAAIVLKEDIALVGGWNDFRKQGPNSMQWNQEVSSDRAVCLRRSDCEVTSASGTKYGKLLSGLNTVAATGSLVLQTMPSYRAKVHVQLTEILTQKCPGLHQCVWELGSCSNESH